MSSADNVIRIVTDDKGILDEIEALNEERFAFVRPEPAPERIPDKVLYLLLF